MSCFLSAFFPRCGIPKALSNGSILPTEIPWLGGAVCVCIWEYVYVHKIVCVYVCAIVCARGRMCTCVNVYVHKIACVRTCVCMLVYMCVKVYVHEMVCVHTCVCVHMCVCTCVCVYQLLVPV